MWGGEGSAIADEGEQDQEIARIQERTKKEREGERGKRKRDEKT